jgi:glycosyltransferase involved in cell wall biosynthesis
MEAKPQFSIIVVCLNPGAELERTIQTILAQACTDYEVIVKDGGSSDGSLQCIPRDDPRFQLIECKDTGVYDAMNQALARASGEWVHFLNTGDYLEGPAVLSRLNRLMYQQPEVNFWYGPYRNRYLERTFQQPSDFSGFTAYRQVICHQTQFIRRAVFEAAGHFDDSLRIRADHDLYLRALNSDLLVSGQYDFIAISYADDGLSVSENMKRCADAEALILHRRHFSVIQRIGYALLLELSLIRMRRYIVRNLKGGKLASVYARLSNAYNRSR